MSNFTYCIATTGQRTPFVFCHYDTTLERAIEYAKQQMLEREIDFITIREGTTDHKDPIVWDSRREPDQVMSPHGEDINFYNRVLKVMDEAGHLRQIKTHQKHRFSNAELMVYQQLELLRDGANARNLRAKILPHRG